MFNFENYLKYLNTRFIKKSTEIHYNPRNVEIKGKNI